MFIKNSYLLIKKKYLLNKSFLFIKKYSIKKELWLFILTSKGICTFVLQKGRCVGHFYVIPGPGRSKNGPKTAKMTGCHIKWKNQHGNWLMG